MNRKLEYMVGQSDGLTMKGMGLASQALGVKDAAAFAFEFTTEAETAFDAFLAETELGAQAILSEVKFGSAGDTTADLAPLFNFMPQRFTLDAFSFSQWVHPYSPTRSLPTGLDLAFALGDNSALVDMQPTAFTTVAPAGMLAAQRTLYESISPTGWKDNLYTSWLDFLRKLNPSSTQSFPAAFQTAAWNRKMRNTQLASWAQLKHNTLLYAKQPYTMGITCEYPKATVEPYPAFFAGLAEYARQGQKAFADVPGTIPGYFLGLQRAAEQLAVIATRTANGELPTEEEAAWLKTALTGSAKDIICGTARVYDGWFMGLIYGSPKEFLESSQNYTIADVHSKPQDDVGPALVLHVATGKINMMAVALPSAECLSLYVGPVSSYYELVESGNTFTRRNDQEWAASLDEGKPIAQRPAWTSSFLYP
jgi:hypothetical protein